MTESPPVADAPTSAPARPRRVKRPIRRTPGTILGFLALGAAATIITLALAAGLYIFKDAYKVTHQTSPTDAADSYLDATLNKRSMSFSETYICAGTHIRRQTAKMISQIKEFEKATPGNFISYNWTDMKVLHRRASRAIITVEVQARTTVGGTTTNNPGVMWTFTLRNESGWKVCSLRNQTG
ncbi:MAG: hypothetical protein WCA46_14235 [Actinocatenispora sp.]